MGRKLKSSKEEKMKACLDYENGHISFKSIALSIGTTKEVVRKWYQIYKEHGPSVFKTSNRNRSYSKDFKKEKIEAYITGKYSQPEIYANIIFVVEYLADGLKNGIMA